MIASEVRSRLRTLVHRPADMPAAAGATSFNRLARSRPSAGMLSGDLPGLRAAVRIADASYCRLRSGRSRALTVASRSARLGTDAHSVRDILCDDMNSLVMTCDDPSTISLFLDIFKLPN
jgi:hypothetical protein